MNSINDEAGKGRGEATQRLTSQSGWFGHIFVIKIGYKKRPAKVKTESNPAKMFPS